MILLREPDETFILSKLSEFNVGEDEFIWLENFPVMSRSSGESVIELAFRAFKLSGKLLIEFGAFEFEFEFTFRYEVFPVVFFKEPFKFPFPLPLLSMLEGDDGDEVRVLNSPDG